MIGKLFGEEIIYYSRDEMCEHAAEIRYMFRREDCMGIIVYPPYFYASADELMFGKKVSFYRMTDENWKEPYKLPEGTIFFDSDQAQKVIDILKEKDNAKHREI